jgi:hypothetical protein
MFRFTIRELVLVQIIVALTFGMWVEGQRRRSAEVTAQAWELKAETIPNRIRARGRNVTFVAGDGEWDLGGIYIDEPAVQATPTFIRAELHP